MSIVATFAEIGGREIVSARSAIESLAEAGIDPSSVTHKCNSYRCGLGETPGKAFLFMLRRDVEQLARGSTAGATVLRTHKLIFGVKEYGGAAKEIAIPNLIFIRAWRLIPGESQDPVGLYVAEFADVRWLADRNFINRRFNRNKTNLSESDLEESTINPDTDAAWTWPELIEAIWGETNETSASGGGTVKVIGDYAASKVPIPTPALTTTPANIRYDDGRSAWRALCDAVRRVGLEMVYDPLASEFRAVQMGNATPWSGASYNVPSMKWEGGAGETFNKMTDRQTTRHEGDLLLEDAETIVGQYAYPKSVTVLFPIAHVSGDLTAPIFDKRGLYWPVEIQGSSLTELGNDAVYVAPAAQAANDTTITIHDQSPARFSDIDDAEPSNQSDLEDRAREVADFYYRSLLDDLPGRWVFSGVRKFIPGQFIGEVVWRDYGDGLKTEVVRYQPPRPEPQERPPFVLSEDSDANGGSDSGCGCCDTWNCADKEGGPGTSDLSEHCDACECGVEVWQIQVPSILCGSSQAGLTHELAFSEDDSTGDICVWTTGLFEDAGRTFEWRLTVEAGPVGQLQLIEFDDDGNAVWIAEWSCSEFCCKCENKMEASCPVYLPPCAGLPTSICLRPWSRTTTVSCGDCEVMPPAYRLTIAGVGGVGCAPDANGTFILRHRSFDPDLEDPDTCYCEWVSSFDSLPIWQLITNSGPLCSSGSNFRLQFITSGSESLVYDSVGFPDPENGNECLADIELALNLNQTNVCTPGSTTVTLEALEKIGEDCDAPDEGCCVFLKWFGTGEGYGTGGTPVDPGTPGWRWVNVTQAQGNSQGCPAASECEECDLAGLPDPSSGAQPLYLVTGCAQ